MSSNVYLITSSSNVGTLILMTRETADLHLSYSIIANVGKKVFMAIDLGNLPSC